MSDEEARRLAEERRERRAAKDFGAADALRDRIQELGFDVTDTPDGFELTPTEQQALQRISPADVPSALEEQARFEFSVHWIVQGWPEDAVRGIAAFRRHHEGRTVQHVVVD